MVVYWQSVMKQELTLVQIIIELVIAAECELSFIVNCYKGKRDSLE